MVLSDAAVSTFDKIIIMWPYILIGALICAAVAAAIVLIVVFAKKNKKK
ncbi:MAG: hypothetical protein J5772_03315 [Clostridia bacterium]|nr:hypothetical protein [Clostridia bacterium]